MTDLAWLMMQSPNYRQLYLSEIERMILPPLRLGQYKVYRKGTRPIGFVTWAWLSEKSQLRFVENPDRMPPRDWKSGDILWFVDFLAPFGDTKSMLRDLRDKVFPDQEGYTLRPRPGGDLVPTLFYGARGAPKGKRVAGQGASKRNRAPEVRKI